MATNNCKGTDCVSMSTTTNVFESNNLGVVHLMNGDFEQAHGLFREAFEETSLHIRILAEEEGPSRVSVTECNKTTQQEYVSIPPGDSTAPAAWTVFQRKPFLPRNLLLDALERAFSNNDDPRNHALMISVSDGGYGVSDEDINTSIDWSLVSAFVVYNLGILYLTSSPQSFIPNQGRRDDDQCQYLRRSQAIFASTKALLQQATRTSTLELTGNPLVDLLSLLTAYKLAETTMDLEGESELQEAYSNELLDLVTRLEAALCHSAFYNDAEVSRLLRVSCQQVVLQYTLLRRRDPSSSAAAA